MCGKIEEVRHWQPGQRAEVNDKMTETDKKC